jgi:hypothetical protein
LENFFGSFEISCLLSEAQLVTQHSVRNGRGSFALEQISHRLDAFDHLSPLRHLHPHNTCRTHVSWDGHSNTNNSKQQCCHLTSSGFDSLALRNSSGDWLCVAQHFGVGSFMEHIRKLKLKLKLRVVNGKMLSAFRVSLLERYGEQC